MPANRQGEDAAARAPEGRSPGRAGEEAEKRSSEGLLLRLALIQLLTNSISSIIGPLVLVLGGYLLLRRWRAEGPPLAPAGVMTPGPATAPGSPDRQEPPLTFDPGTEALAGPEASRDFDPGLTYEEEMALKKEALRQQEEALLRHIYEENVRLLEQLGELQGAVAR